MSPLSSTLIMPAAFSSGRPIKCRRWRNGTPEASLRSTPMITKICIISFCVSHLEPKMTTSLHAVRKSPGGTIYCQINLGGSNFGARKSLEFFKLFDHFVQWPFSHQQTAAFLDENATFLADPEALAVALLKAKMVLLSRLCKPPANPTAILCGP